MKEERNLHEVSHRSILADTTSKIPRIKVIGIGGTGRNVVNHMIEQGINGVEFITIDTDEDASHRSRATTQLQIGAALTKGMGSGSKPAVGRAAAEEDRERIKEIISGASMVFITTGMGGGTGTGAVPVVAQIADELDILSVAVVTYPFASEGNRVRYADKGIKALHEHVDALTVVSNIPPNVDYSLTIPEVFKINHQSIYRLVADMVGMINESGLINIDIADIRSLLSKSGMALMGSAAASGSDRAKVATERAIENMAISGARGMLMNITSTDSLKVREMAAAMDCVALKAPYTPLILGSVYDESMGDELRVTVLATGLSVPQDCDYGDSK